MMGVRVLVLNRIEDFLELNSFRFGIFYIMANLNEWSFLKAPYEELSSTYKSNKRKIEKEISFVLSQLKIMKNKSNILDRNQCLAAISGLKSRLSSFQSTLPQLHHSEDNWLSIYESRIQFASSSENSTTRLYLFLIDYFTRQKNFDLSRSISSKFSLDSSSDVYFFEKAEKIKSDLLKHDLSSSIEWCSIHKSKLKKLKSVLEFQLKLQKFIGFIQVQNNFGAILYSQSNFPEYPEHQETIQKAMMLLITQSRPEFPEYQEMLSESRWEFLADLFEKEMKRVYGFTTESLIEIYVRAGFISIKSPLCEAGNKVFGCPTCNVELQKLAKGIPNASHSQTYIVCRILGTPIDENNPPLVLPNGQVFSEQGINKICEAGKITCPVTGALYSRSQAVKVFIV
jgi:hypothetical protein